MRTHGGWNVFLPAAGRPMHPVGFAQKYKSVAQIVLDEQKRR